MWMMAASLPVRQQQPVKIYIHIHSQSSQTALSLSRLLPPYHCGSTCEPLKTAANRWNAYDAQPTASTGKRKLKVAVAPKSPFPPSFRIISPWLINDPGLVFLSLCSTFLTAIHTAMEHAKDNITSEEESDEAMPFPSSPSPPHPPPQPPFPSSTFSSLPRPPYHPSISELKEEEDDGDLGGPGGVGGGESIRTSSWYHRLLQHASSSGSRLGGGVGLCGGPGGPLGEWAGPGQGAGRL